MTKNILPVEYLDDILIRLAHHSTAIEGNTITLPETVSIILNNTTTGNRNYNLREIYEIQNHKQAFEYLLDSLDKNLTVDDVKKYHKLLTDRLQYDKGCFKTDENAIRGADFDTASPRDTPHLMGQWVDNLNYRIENSVDENGKLEAIMEGHIEFERIHPFSDGNGRTGRMIVNHSLMSNGMSPLIIKLSDKQEYINLLSNQDVKGLTNLAGNLIKKESNRQQAFVNTEKQQIPLAKTEMDLEM